MNHFRWKTPFARGLLLLNILLLSQSRAEAWGAAGHRVIANIAYDRLDDAMRSRIVKILLKHEDFDKRFKQRMPAEILAGSAEEDRWIFLQASIWPDLIRGMPKFSI